MSTATAGNPEAYSLEAEMSVIGGALIDPTAIPRVTAILDEGSFFLGPHKRLFRALVQLHERGELTDPVTLAEALRTAGDFEAIGGAPYLAELWDYVPTAANIEYHARIVAERAAERKQAEIRRKVAELAADPQTSAATFAATTADMLRAMEGTGREAPPTLAKRWGDGLLDAALDPSRPLVRLEDAGLGAWVDRTLGGGLQPGNMVGLVSAGAGTGKTALAHQMADGFAKWSASALAGAAGSNGGHPVVVPTLFVTEMQARDLTLRTLAREAAVPGKLLRAPASREGRQFTPAEQERVIAASAPYRQSDPPQRATDGEVALWAAREAARHFAPAAELFTPLDRTSRLGTGSGAVRAIHRHAVAIRGEWERRGAEVAAVLLVIDPLHRLLDPSLEETAGLGDVLGELLSISHAEGFITLFTSDTTKSAVGARGTDQGTREQRAELAFRGSYQLLHIPDFAYALEVPDPDQLKAGTYGADAYAADDARSPLWSTVYAELVSPKLRWGRVGESPGFWYDRALFRFSPIPAPR